MLLYNTEQRHNPENSGLVAMLAGAMHFQRLCLRTEAERLRLRLDQFGDPVVTDLLRAGTGVADQERHLVRFRRMVAGNERIDRFELVNETVLEQEVERT